MIKFLVYIIPFTILFSCKKEVNQDEVHSMAWTPTPYNSLIQRVKSTGDTVAYNELLVEFRDSYDVSVDSLIKYSKIMALKYKDTKASFDYLDALLYKDTIDTQYYQKYSNLNITKMPKERKLETIHLLKDMVQRKIISQAQFDSIQK